MAPDPRGQEDAGHVGSIIAGHKISLNVHYDGNDTLPGKLDSVTPVEERIVSTGALSLDSPDRNALNNNAARTLNTFQVEPKENTEKVTHVDHVIMNKVETEHESLEYSLPSSSSLSEARAESPETSSVRPETPETTSAYSGHIDSPQPPPNKIEPVPATDDMFRTQNREDQWLNGPDQIIPTNDVKTWLPAGAVKLKIGTQGMSAHTPISVPSLLKKTAEKMPEVSAIAVKENDVWHYMNYREYYQNVRLVAKGFIKLGLERFHGVCILGFNSPEWFLSDLGSIFAGGFAAGLYTTNSPEACEHCAVNCEAQIFVVEDKKQLDKILKIKPNLPNLKAIIQYKGKPTTEGVLSWEQLLDLGRQQSDNILEERLRRIAINQCCTLIYTSGTTGAPKGVMLTHDNVTWTAYSMTVDNNLIAGKESVVSYLPLSHVAAQVADIYVSMTAIGTVYFAQPDALKGSLGLTLKEVRPTQFLGVPRVWEKIYEKMQEVGRKTKGVKKSIATWAKSIGTETNLRRAIGDQSKPFGFSVANALVFQKIKAVLGLDRCVLTLSGAAPIAPEVVKYFHSLDICLTEIYGMSESSGPHTIGTSASFRFGSTGKTISGCYTKLDKEDADGNGEICMGGRNVCMGYLQMEDKTHESIDDDGWLHSGDIGKIDKDGFLFITGRLKELIITAGGENIPPVLIEDQLKGELQCISNAMLIGDKRKFLSILLTLKTEMDLDSGEALDQLAPATKEWCRSIGSSANKIQDVLSGPDPHIMRGIQDGIDRANNKACSNAQKIQKWTIIPRDFTVATEELGPTMKLKRPVVVKKYRETIERFYQ